MTAATTKHMWEEAERNIKKDQAPHPADEDYIPPAASVKLPSRGLVYPPDSPLFNLESIDIKPVTAKEENILSSATLIKNGTVLSVLLKACITNRRIDPEQMLVGDRNAVLTAIRISAYGPTYFARVMCPECHDERDHEFDLSRLRLKTLDDMPIGGVGNNEFSFKLPSNGHEVRFKLMDAQTASRLEKDQDGLRKKTGQEQNVTLRLQAQVISINGVSDPAKLARLIEGLLARDARALRLYMDEMAPEVDMVQDYSCKSCGKETEVDIPLGTEFFWPSKHR